MYELKIHSEDGQLAINYYHAESGEKYGLSAEPRGHCYAVHKEVEGKVLTLPPSEVAKHWEAPGPHEISRVVLSGKHFVEDGGERIFLPE